MPSSTWKKIRAAPTDPSIAFGVLVMVNVIRAPRGMSVGPVYVQSLPSQTTATGISTGATDASRVAGAFVGATVAAASAAAGAGVTAGSVAEPPPALQAATVTARTATRVIIRPIGDLPFCRCRDLQPPDVDTDRWTGRFASG